MDLSPIDPIDNLCTCKIFIEMKLRYPSLHGLDRVSFSSYCAVVQPNGLWFFRAKRLMEKKMLTKRGGWVSYSCSKNKGVTAGGEEDAFDQERQIKQAFAPGVCVEPLLASSDLLHFF
jgi:hypothetical protein